MAIAIVTVDFSNILAELEADKELQEAFREHQKELDRSSRAILTVLNKVHSIPFDQVHDIVKQTQTHFHASRCAIRAIINLVPKYQYYKWNETWSSGLQRSAYSAALAFYLSTGKLIRKEQVAQILDIKVEDSDRFLLSTEEYLHSLVSLVNELSRLAVNSVTLGDFGTPLRLSVFVKELYSGFQLLNLKNDSLRKRFDSIKYDVKKIEEVVYDISLRGLTKGENVARGVGEDVDEATAEGILKFLGGLE